MQKSKIEWTETTWNPVIGCSRVSRECINCYAETMAHRFSGPGQYAHGLTVVGKNGPRWSGVVRSRPEKLNEPIRWRRPRVVFVNSMSDLFHEAVPDEFIGQVFEVMTKLAPHHVYQVLTKRAERLADLGPSLPWTPNVWMGVSVGTADAVGRVDHLRRVPAKVKFISAEPLIEDIADDLDLHGIDWLIAGGESGHKRSVRSCSADWVRALRDACVEQKVAFFHKQWGRLSNNPDQFDPTAKENGGTAKGGRMLDGRTWDEMPATSSPAT